MGKELTKLFVPKEETNSKSIGIFNRETFRETEPFRSIYGTFGENVKEYYKKLYEFYNILSKEGIEMNPKPKRIEEFDSPITDSDIHILEADTAILYSLVLNFNSAILDTLAKRPFIPRDPTTDGSYETAERMKREKENQ